jgi:hypothetical protein
VTHDVAALFAILEVIGESVAYHGVNHAVAESATKLLSASKSYVSNLQTLVTKYEDLPIASQRVWLRTMGGAEELVGLRGQLRENIHSCSALNKNITRYVHWLIYVDRCFKMVWKSILVFIC